MSTNQIDNDGHDAGCNDDTIYIELETLEPDTTTTAQHSATTTTTTTTTTVPTATTSHTLHVNRHADGSNKHLLVVEEMASTLPRYRTTSDSPSFIQRTLRRMHAFRTIAHHFEPYPMHALCIVVIAVVYQVLDVSNRALHCD
jgi:hypothetical protein